MGLDAAVYKNVSALKARYGTDAFDVEPETGEPVLKSELHLKVPRSTLIAIERRLGNIDGVGKLRTKLAGLLDGGKSILLRKVLYSGSHGGDIIGSVELDKISEEIEIIRNGTTDTSVIVFANQMEELVGAALAEGNPIVFV